MSRRSVNCNYKYHYIHLPFHWFIQMYVYIYIYHLIDWLLIFNYVQNTHIHLVTNLCPLQVVVKFYHIEIFILSTTRFRVSLNRILRWGYLELYQTELAYHSPLVLLDDGALIIWSSKRKIVPPQISCLRVRSLKNLTLIDP